MENLGNEAYVHFTIDRHPFIARMDPGVVLHAGDTREMWFDTRHLHIFDRQTGDTLMPGVLR